MKDLYLVDYHVHTSRCGHACGEDREYIEEAIRKGLREIGFSDHVPRFYQPKSPDMIVTERGMSFDDLDRYVESVLSYRSEYKDIQIKMGLEVDYVPGWEKQIEDIGRQYPWDYLIGSVHFVPEWNYGYILREKEHPPAEIYPRYFSLVAEAAASKLFDILGHIDLPKRAFFPLESSSMLELYQNLAESLGKNHAVVEINTYGLRSSKINRGEIYPNPVLLNLCHENEVRVTLGSDAHRPQDVGLDFDQAIKILSETGYQNITSFNQRIPTMINWEN